jgi:hypothetical protein
MHPIWDVKLLAGVEFPWDIKGGSFGGITNIFALVSVAERTAAA